MSLPMALTRPLANEAIGFTPTNGAREKSRAPPFLVDEFYPVAVTRLWMKKIVTRVITPDVILTAPTVATQRRSRSLRSDLA